MRNLTRSFRRELPNAKTLPQKVAAVLRKYGTDAHVYLPGIGVINGLTAGNYLDSAGTTAATVDNPVGLVEDANGTINALQATTANKPVLRRTNGRYWWDMVDSTDVLTATFPAGYESATIINTAETGQVTYTAQNIVGNYDIRGAVIGSELVTNGDFNNGTTGWTGSGTPVFTIVSGQAKVKNGAAITSAVNQTINTVIGKTYIFYYWVDPALSNGGVVIRARDAVALTVLKTDTRTVAGLYSASFTAIGTTTQIQLINSSSTLGASFLADNISVKELTPKEYGRFIFRTGLTADELTTMQTFANRLAGV